MPYPNIKFNGIKLSDLFNPVQVQKDLKGNVVSQTDSITPPKEQPDQKKPPQNIDLNSVINNLYDKFKPPIKPATLYDKAKASIEPYATQGLKDYKTLGEMIKGGQFDTKMKDFDYMMSPPSDFKFDQMPEAYKYQQFQYNPNEDPGTQFRMQQGTQAMNTSAAARGGALSGAQLKALTNYGQQLGSQEYQNSYNRFMQGQGMQAGLAQQNIMNAQQQQAAKYADYANRMNQWNTNKNFAYNQYTDKYNMLNQQAQQKYGQMVGLANVGIASGQNMANVDLAQAGAINAQQAQQAALQNQLQMQQNQIAAQNAITSQNNKAGFWNGMLQLGGTLGGALIGGLIGGPPGAMIGGSIGGIGGGIGGNIINPNRNIPQLNYNQFSQQQYYG